MKQSVLAALVAGSALWPGPAAACRMALLLAIDVSASVDAREYRLQTGGLAAALLSADIRAEILSRPGYPVALAAYEFSGRYGQKTVLDWILLETEADIARAARTLANATRSETEFPTAIGYALGHSATLFRAAPDCAERKLDLSGDGPNNEGFAPALAYRYFPLDGITVNALAIGGAEPAGDLAEYYRSEVIRGPGAFVEIADNHAGFAEAMRRKLLRELKTRLVGQARNGSG